MARVGSSGPSPDQARLINPMWPLVRGFFWATLIILLLPLALLPFPVEPELIVGSFIVAACLGLSMAIATVSCLFNAFGVGRRVRRFQEGDYLVRWTYTAQEWQVFAEAESGRTRRAAANALLLGLWLAGLPGLILGGSGGWVIYKQLPLVLIGALVGAGIFGTVGTAIGWLVRSLVRGRAGHVVRRVLEAPRMAYIGHDAVYCAGKYLCWKAFATKLGRLRLLDDEATLEITVFTRVRRSDVENRVCVPVPSGHRDEAIRLIHRLIPRS